jgi:hypothetical protein
MVHWPARDVPALSTVDVHRGHRSGRVPCGLSGAILKAIASLERKVIAEGVETAEQAKALNDLRCAFAQGYLYSRQYPPAISTRCSRPALGCPSNSGHDVAVGATVGRGRCVRPALTAVGRRSRSSLHVTRTRSSRSGGCMAGSHAWAAAAVRWHHDRVVRMRSAGIAGVRCRCHSLSQSPRRGLWRRRATCPRARARLRAVVGGIRSRRRRARREAWFFSPFCFSCLSPSPARGCS